MKPRPRCAIRLCGARSIIDLGLLPFCPEHAAMAGVPSAALVQVLTGVQQHVLFGPAAPPRSSEDVKP